MVSLGPNGLKLCFAAETTAAEGSSLLATSGPLANSMPISVSGPLCTLPVYLELGRHFRSLPVGGCSRRSESRQGPQDRALRGSWGLVVLLMITAVDGQCVVYQQGAVFVRTLLIIQLTSYITILRDIWGLTSLKWSGRKIPQIFRCREGFIWGNLKTHFLSILNTEMADVEEILPRERNVLHCQNCGYWWAGDTRKAPAARFWHMFSRIFQS